MVGGDPSRKYALYKVFVILPRKNSQIKLNLDIRDLFVSHQSGKCLSPWIYIHESMYCRLEIYLFRFIIIYYPLHKIL